MPSIFTLLAVAISTLPLSTQGSQAGHEGWQFGIVTNAIGAGDPAYIVARGTPGLVGQRDSNRPSESLDNPKAEAQRESKALAAFEILNRERDSALIHYNYLIPGRRTPRKRKEAYDKWYPKPADWAPRYAQIAEAYPKTEGASLALTWVVRHLEVGKLHETSRATLLRDHMSRPQLAQICAVLGRVDSLQNRADLAKLHAKSPVVLVQATAIKTLCVMDVAKTMSLEDPALRALLEQRIALLRENYGATVIDGKLGSEWASQISLELHHLSLGQQFLDWQTESLSGKVGSPTDYRGKVLLLFFWKSSETDCRKILPHVNALGNKWRKQPFAIHGVSGDLDVNTAKRWSTTLGLPFDNWHSPASKKNSKGKVSDIFGVNQWPTFFVLDESGKIVSAATDFAHAKTSVEAALRLLAQNKAKESIPTTGSTGKERQEAQTPPGPTPEPKKPKGKDPEEAKKKGPPPIQFKQQNHGESQGTTETTQNEPDQSKSQRPAPNQPKLELTNQAPVHGRNHVGQ